MGLFIALGDEAPIAGTRLLGTIDDRRCTLRGPCGHAHTMTFPEALALAVWLTRRVPKALNIADRAEAPRLPADGVSEVGGYPNTGEIAHRPVA